MTQSNASERFESNYDAAYLGSVARNLSFREFASGLFGFSISGALAAGDSPTRNKGNCRSFLVYGSGCKIRRLKT
jgi:hypothetical protein